MNTITTDQLTQWLEAGEDVLLIDVLPPEDFEKKHIPGAENIPVQADDFVERVDRRASGDRKRRVVVYCSNEQCDASPRAVQRLEKARFENVFAYESGIAGYRKSGRPLAGTDATSS
ncbi:MAG TPA: rhodanese-like domain-containing protein [Planctomycetota bacterium]|nr:rhodanese-like domain-containing protein [Planctomycetota bacterium]